MAGAYPEHPPEPSGNLIDRAEISFLEDRMDSDKDKRPDHVLGKESQAEGPIVDESWSKVDLHDQKKTPDADTPSDLEPEGD